jgi:transcriptional regulator with XRE-family HTH domain
VELGRSVGTTHSYVAQLRRGVRDNPNLRIVERLAEVLDVHPAYFVGGRTDRALGSLRVRTFAQALNRLFSLVHRSGGEELSYRYVISTIRQRGVERRDRTWTISSSTLKDYRCGDNPNPDLKHILALADVFGAPSAYFFDEELAARIDEQLETARVMDLLGVNEVILRTTEHEASSEVRQKVVLALVDALRPGARVTEVLTEAVRSAPVGTG